MVWPTRSKMFLVAQPRVDVLLITAVKKNILKSIDIFVQRVNGFEMLAARAKTSGESLVCRSRPPVGISQAPSLVDRTAQPSVGSAKFGISVFIPDVPTWDAERLT